MVWNGEHEGLAGKWATLCPAQIRVGHIIFRLCRKRLRLSGAHADDDGDDRHCWLMALPNKTASMRADFTLSRYASKAKVTSAGRCGADWQNSCFVHPRFRP